DPRADGQRGRVADQRVAARRPGRRGARGPDAAQALLRVATGPSFAGGRGRIAAMRRLAALIVPLALGLAWAAGPSKVGDGVADATLAMADGTEKKLSAYEGNAVLLFFYGTWERHAAADAKQVEAIRKARETQRLTVLGIARDAKPAD